jgi:hypothetical protein
MEPLGTELGREHECDAISVAPPFDTADARDRWAEAAARAGHPGLPFMFAGFPPDEFGAQVRRCFNCGAPIWVTRAHRMKLAEMHLGGCSPREICVFCAPDSLGTVHLMMHLGEPWAS